MEMSFTTLSSRKVKYSRRATVVPDLQKFPYSSRLCYLNLSTLDYRRDRGDMIQVFKLIHNIDDYDYTKLFRLSFEGYVLVCMF